MIHFCQNYTTRNGKLMVLLVDSNEKTSSLYGENKTWISYMNVNFKWFESNSEYLVASTAYHQPARTNV